MSLTTSPGYQTTPWPMPPDNWPYQGFWLLRPEVSNQLISPAPFDTGVQAYSAFIAKCQSYGGWSTGATYTIRLIQPYVAFLCNKAYSALFYSLYLLYAVPEILSAELQWSHSLILPTAAVYIASAQSIFRSRGNRSLPWRNPVLPYFLWLV